jgi:ATP-dependent Lon protease
MSIKPKAYYNLTRLYNTEYNDVYVLIETYTLEAGVRKIKEKIVEIIREINLKRFYSEDSVKLPYTVTKDFCIELFENK